MSSKPSGRATALRGSPADRFHTSDGRDSAVESILRDTTDLGALPETVRRILEITADPDASLQQLRQLIYREPAVAIRLLKVVNSAFYGLRGQVGSIDRAIRLLGFNAVRSITLATGILPLFRRDQLHPSFNLSDLSRHCTAVAVGACLLVGRTGVGGPDEAFVAGLLHDVGILAEVRVRRPLLVNALKRLEHEPMLTFRAAERAEIGATHDQVGAALCRRWGLPEATCHAVGCHHRPAEAGRTLAGLVHIADVIAARLKIGYTRTVEEPQVPVELLDLFGISPEDVQRLMRELPEALREAHALFPDQAA